MRQGAARLTRAHADDLAAILVEPMQGSGGCIPAEPGFLQALRDGADRDRRGADLRRGDDEPDVRRRAAGAARHHAGHDDARQIHRRRDELRRVRRAARHHGPLRPTPAGRAAACRHVQQQRADHGRGRGRALPPVHGRGGGRAVRARRGVARPAERAGAAGYALDRAGFADGGAFRRASRRGCASCSSSTCSIVASTSRGAA